MIRTVYLVSCILFLCSSCSNSETTQKQQKFYFDIKSYFEDEIKQLNMANPMVNKTIIHNGKTEQKEIKNTDWNTELLAFSESDINKPAWKDAYLVDTTEVNDELLITYKAKEDKLSIQLIKISINKSGAVNRIEINKHPDKKIFSAQTQLVYTPNKGYSISNSQKLIAFDKDAFIVTATFIK